MLYLPWMVLLGDHGIKKIRFENSDFLAVQGEKLHERVVHWPIKPLLVETIICGDLRSWIGEHYGSCGPGKLYCTTEEKLPQME